MQFLIDHSMYVSLVIAVIVMSGVLLYLWLLDRRLARLERGETAPSVADSSRND